MATKGFRIQGKDFIELTKQKLGIRAKGRDVVGDAGSFQLMEPATPYKADFDPEIDLLSLENDCFWDETD